MSERKTIVVTGATGAQGGGLARAVLEDAESRFIVRALTRHPRSDKARELAAMGAEVVGADLDDAASVRAAFGGAYGAFCVTNFWEHFSPEREQVQAGHMAEAARAAGLQHVIWSTLEDVRRWIPLADDSIPTLNGKYKVPHFDGKGGVDHVFTDLGVPTTFLRASFYWENFIHFGMGPRRMDDGRLVLSLPMADRKLTGIAAGDIGRCAYGIFQHGVELLGRTVGVAGEHLTGEEMAARMGEALTEPVHYDPMSFEAYRDLGFPGSSDLGNMFQFYCDFETLVREARPVELSRKLNPRLQNFAQWLAVNGKRIPVDPPATAGAGA